VSAPGGWDDDLAVLPDTSYDDAAYGWGDDRDIGDDRTTSDDRRLRDERPPHWS
jgi:hypothetical protein